MSGGHDGAMRVLGVDPGANVTGWGVVERRRGSVRHVAHGTVTLRRDGGIPRRLATIHRALAERCVEFAPDVFALERSFVGRNVQSAFRLGEVRGVAMLTAALAGIPVVEYAPAQVKLAVTGAGRAEKDAVGRAVARELALAATVAVDAADALAIALCHLFTARWQLAVGASLAAAETVRRPRRERLVS